MEGVIERERGDFDTVLFFKNIFVSKTVFLKFIIPPEYHPMFFIWQSATSLVV
jgi:hypothetical protein